MKKTILILALLLGGLASIHAQYSTDPSNNLKISNLSRTSEGHVKILPDGKAYIAYISWETNTETGDTASSAYLKLQMLDKSGNIMPNWPEGGMYVSKHFTASYDTDFGMEIAPDGSIVLVHSDSRDNLSKANPIFRPYVYKINKNAEFVWNSEGVGMISDPTRTTCQRPKVFFNNSGDPIIIWSDVTNENTASIGLTRLDPETGDKLFEPVTVPNAIQGLVVPSDGDNIIIVYKMNPDPEYVAAVKYDKGGNRITTGAWSNVVKLGILPVANKNAIAGAESDGEEGAIACWQGVSGNGHYIMTQRIDKNGNLTMGADAIKASGIFFVSIAPKLAVDKANKEVYTLFTRAYSASAQYGYVSKLNYNGNFLFADTIKQIMSESPRCIVDGLSITGNGVIGVVTTSATISADSDQTMRAFGMSRDGSIRWGTDTSIVSSMTGRKTYANISAYNEKQVIAIWMKIVAQDRGDIYAQNVVNDEDAPVGMNPIQINEIASFKAYPNPTTNYVNIEVNLTTAQKINIEIFDINGKKVRTLANDKKIEGMETFVWNTAGVTKGIYFVSVSVGQAKRMSKVIVQ